MSNFNNKTITSKGLELLSAALAGGKLEFTRIVMGDGTYDGDSVLIESLVSQKQSLDIKSITRKGSQVILSTTLVQLAITQDFYWKEIGVYAKGSDGTELLYIYGSATDKSFISKDMLNEKMINIGVLVSNAKNVTATINNSLVYLSKMDLEAHNNDANAHQPIRTWITNLFANLTLPWSKITEKPSAYPPSAHTHSKSQIADFPVSLPASDVYSWAKQPTKPNYNALEVGAIPSTATCNKNWNWNGQSGQPSWVWGGENGTDMYVYNPANFSVYNSARLGGYTLDEIKSKFGGDIVGKQMLYETIVVVLSKEGTATLMKSYSNVKGGMVRLVLGGGAGGYLPQSFDIITDGVVVCTKAPSTHLAGSSGSGYLHFVDIPFENSFIINGYTKNSTADVAHGISLIYYINK